MEYKEEEYQITNEQFIEGVVEIIGLTKNDLELLKKSYEKTKDPLCKVEIEKYTETLVELVEMMKTFVLKIESGIELQAIIVFSEDKALFGYRGKKDVDFSKKWFNIIVRKKENGSEMFQ